jgi:lipid-binding SYLF domain-containing protein
MIAATSRFTLATVFRTAVAGLCCLFLSACVTGGGSVVEKRQIVHNMRDDVLTQLYSTRPDVRDQINAAPGSAVFSNANVNLIFASFGGGYGIMHNNRTGRATYLRMGEVGLGLGVGVKDYRIVMVFHTDDAMQRFEEYGVAVGAQADAAARAGQQGAAVGGELTLDNITVYQITEAGLALQATLKGTKYWPDPALN